MKLNGGRCVDEGRVTVWDSVVAEVVFALTILESVFSLVVGLLLVNDFPPFAAVRHWNITLKISKLIGQISIMNNKAYFLTENDFPSVLSKN